MICDLLAVERILIFKFSDRNNLDLAIVSSKALQYLRQTPLQGHYLRPSFCKLYHLQVHVLICLYLKDKSHYLRFQSQQKLQTWRNVGKRLIRIKPLGSKSEVRGVIEDSDKLVDDEKSVDERDSF